MAQPVDEAEKSGSRCWTDSCRRLHGGYRVRTANGALIVSTARGGKGWKARIGPSPPRETGPPLVVQAGLDWHGHISRPHPFRKERQACMNSWRCISTANSSPARAGAPGRHQPGHARSAGPAAPRHRSRPGPRARRGPARLRVLEEIFSHGPFRHPAQGRPAAQRTKSAQHDPGPGQAAGRGRGRSLVLRRARRLARRGMPPHLRPRDPAAQPGRAPDRGARAHRRVRCLHALELPYNQAIRKIAAALGAAAPWCSRVPRIRRPPSWRSRACSMRPACPRAA